MALKTIGIPRPGGKIGWTGEADKICCECGLLVFCLSRSPLRDSGDEVRLLKLWCRSCKQQQLYIEISDMCLGIITTEDVPRFPFCLLGREVKEIAQSSCTQCRKVGEQEWYYATNARL